MKNNKGFSLVELIVVIAIMAILAAVAVIGVSVYIPKAQQANDKQLVSDIEYALTLAGYNGDFEEGQGGYIILTTEGVKNAADIKENNPELAQVLANAYGDKWDKEMKLAYDEWGNNYLFVGLAGNNAQSVYNSTYYAVSDELMGQVKDITDAALSILDSGVGSGNSRNDMINMFAGEGDADGESAFLEGVAQQYGYSSLDEVSNEELPNLLVLAVATDITTESNNPDGYEMSQASGLIKDFALYNGYAATAEGKAAGFDEEYDKFVTALNNAKNSDNPIGAVADAYNELKNAASTDAYETYANGIGQNDVKAFDAMLAGLAGSTLGSKEQTKDNLGDANFFTTGVGNTLFGTYIDSVESFVGVQANDAFMTQMSQPGVVGIYFTYMNSQVVTNNSLPID